MYRLLASYEVANKRGERDGCEMRYGQIRGKKSERIASGE